MRQLVVYCFRDHDCRLSDNPALQRAIDVATQNHAELALCLFIEHDALFSPQRAVDVAYMQVIQSLSEHIETLGGKLHIFSTDIKEIIKELLAYYDVQGVFWNRRYQPTQIDEDAQLKAYLQQHHINCGSRNSALLFEPFESRALKADLTAYKVFTPFANNLLNAITQLPEPLPPPSSLKQTISLETNNTVELPTLPAWGNKVLSHWILNEEQAQKHIDDWLTRIDDYDQSRNLPAQPDGTSKLSPYLRFGLCSPKQVAYAIMNHSNCAQLSALSEGELTFLKEILWREFAYYTLYHFPDTIHRPFRSKFAQFPWYRPNEEDDNLRAWQMGQTGVPIVDTGMRELWATGWMHNRVRMVVASWLCKNMNIHWQVGAKWFMHTLIDADMASNTLAWQWVAGCGVDAAPYFRVFNPILQAKKFDPKADYVKKWLPELRELPVKQCFEPWHFNEHSKAPILDISATRKAALKRYKQWS